ncbi:MAG TPA: GIY-YIG nuclease family protein [Acidiphilium sp.]|nr:MAG: endonuclease [Acidiphilium sp. 34-60-192]HQT90258.1 GIY-YIG nuclease family protein [Acidiphilium sp.]
MKQPAVYILTNRWNGTLYTGVTSNLAGRVWQHRNGIASAFTTRHGCKHLVWFERHETMIDAITREKQIKAGSRLAKIQLIAKTNPQWQDLYNEIM